MGILGKRRTFKNSKLLRRLSIAILLLGVILLWQNCGNINLSANLIEVPLGSVSSEESAPTPFRLPDTPDLNMRVAFVVDVSASMQTKGCPGTGADYDTGDCTNGNVGADPYFNRLRMIENWIVQIDDYLAARGLPMNRLEMAFFPFSMSNGTGDPMAVNGSVRFANRIDVYLNQKTFTSDRRAIRRILDSYRKMYFAMHGNRGPDPRRMEAAWGLDNLEEKQTWEAAGVSYIKTSIPVPSIDRARESILAEINQIRSATPSQISQTRFEVVFLSDGVAKPHHDDIRQSFELLWQARKVYRDYKWQHLYRERSFCFEVSSNACAFSRVDFSQAGLNCTANCRSSIDYLIRTGTRSYAESALCRQCMISILDYTSTPQLSENGPPFAESFLNATRLQWGEHQLNYNLTIQRSLRAMDTMFRQNAEVQYRFSFVRFDSEIPRLKTPDLLLTLERNWLEQSRVKFRGQHRHAVVTSNRVPFALFPGQSEVNGYKLSHFFLINPHARINSAGFVTLDSDADGLYDHEENFMAEDFDSTRARSNNVCLDSIVFRTDSCFQTGCDPQIDLDGDGLNQCEEATILTDDMDLDTDGDGISDYFEVIYGLNPKLNDSDQDSNGDGVSNFVNFTVGAGPWTYVNDIPSFKKIGFTIREANPVPISVGSQTALVPTYAFRVTNLPTIQNLNATGGQATYFSFAKRPEHENTPPLLARDYVAGSNRVLMIGRVDHNQNRGDVFWLYKPIDVPFSLSPIRLDIQLNSLEVMPWLDSDLGGTP